MKLSIDRDLCIGCGLCATIDDEIFAMDDTSVATVIAQPEGKHEATALDAVQSCPAGAILVDD